MPSRPRSSSFTLTVLRAADTSRVICLLLLRSPEVGRHDECPLCLAMQSAQEESKPVTPETVGSMINRGFRPGA